MGEVDLEAYPIVFGATSAGDRYGGIDNVVLESYRYVPRDNPPHTVMVFMHPVGGLTYLPFLRDLARSGVHVISCGNRYRGNDASLLVENIAVDLHECIRHAKRKFGYERVVLGGWSGGGAPAVFYQAEAETPSVTAAPGGGGPNLVERPLEPADAIVLVAAHAGRHVALREFIDPSVIDEADLTVRDRSLDLYDRANPEQPPYSADFLVRYREAQLERIRRITAWVREQLSASDDERGFVVANTMADPKWLDPSIDANDREPGTCFLGPPELANNAPAGVARFSSLHSWLSQWSYDDARADGPRCAARVSVPALVVTNSADDACGPSHSQALFEGFGHTDKEHVTIKGATHYYLGADRTPMHEATATVIDWLARHGLHGR